MYMNGVKVPKLGSVQDRVLRQYMIKESEKESAKTNLLALLVANCIPFDDQAKASEWNSKVKRIWSSYLALEYGLDVAPEMEKEVQMQEYYQKHVKALKPRLSIGKDGKPVVTGLDSLGQ